MPTQPEILTLENDLLFSSFIREVGERMGCSVTIADDLETFRGRQESSGASLLIIDLGFPGLDIAALVSEARRRNGVAVIAFGRHTEGKLLQAARQAGCEEVLPRSSFVEELPSLVEKYRGRAVER
ncbi:MAG TPA: response regulator [Dehalococcoidia bacterium]|nr:response regulator [Dehalococcoidia bacterium]